MGNAPLQAIMDTGQIFLQATSMPGRKIPAALENPVDNLWLGAASRMAPALRATGHTPNALTTYALGSGALSLVALWHGHVSTFGALWLLRGFWDCADGYFARRYGMVTRVGDAYDHVSDTSTMLALLYVVHAKYVVPPALWVGLAALLAAQAVQLGCQQSAYDSGAGESLDAFRAACPGQARSTLRWSRWLGHGTMQVALVAAVVWLEKSGRRRPAAGGGAPSGGTAA